MESCDTPVTNNKAYDPGWNDPPTISYNALQVTPNRPRNFLNKRVAFPLSGAGSTATQTSPLNMPPLPTTIQKPPPCTSVSNEDKETQIDTQTTLQEVKDILLKLIDANNGLGTKTDSIKRKVCVMEEMWENGKLNVQVQTQMRDLAYALRDDKPNKADDIHKALMVDHVSEVCTWMPGVKQLIYHCIACSELLAIDKVE